MGLRALGFFLHKVQVRKRMRRGCFPVLALLAAVRYALHHLRLKLPILGSS